MEKKKNILLHLYGDPDAEGDLRSLLGDDDLQREHQALSEAKFRMDHLSRSRPDPNTIDRIVAQAAEAASSPAVGIRRGDRPALWRSRPLRRVLIPAVSLAAAIVLAVGSGMFNFSSDDNALLNSESMADHRAAEAESLLRTTPIAPPNLATRSSTRDIDPLLVWDDSNRLRELYRRIETMRPTDDLDWGARSIPLETLPGSIQTGRQRLLQAAVQR